MNRVPSIILSVLVIGSVGRLCGREVNAQNRPVIDEGTVTDNTRTPSVPRVRLDRGPGPVSINAVLVVVTNRPNADVTINGDRHRATGLEFRTQLRAGRQYTIEVSAGDDYIPFRDKITLKSAQVVNAPLVSKFGTVSLGPAFPDGAKVLVDGQAVDPGHLLLDEKTNMVVISGLTPGSHTIAYDHPEYVIVEHRFDISPGSSLAYTFNPLRAEDDLMVATDPNAAIYVDGQRYGETAGDGNLRISVRLGSHEVKVEKYGFEPFKQNVEFKFRSPVSIARRLAPIPNSAEFHEDFDVAQACASKWSMPSSGCKLDNGRFYLENCPELAYPKGLNYRDFSMGFHLKVENGQGAAWALRVKDSRNYYLFYLTGPGAAIPNRFLTYVVRDDKFDPSNPDDSVPLIFALEAGGEYSVEITAIANVISHKITSARTGRDFPTGEFKDNDSTFLFGDIGFRTVGSERFSVDEVYVRPPAIKPSS
jgi:hypothetical protein